MLTTNFENSIKSKLNTLGNDIEAKITETEDFLNKLKQNKNEKYTTLELL